MECYTPYPVEEAAEALRFHKTRVPLVCLLGGLLGVTTAFLMETWINVWAISAEHRGASAVLVAGVHHPGVRVDDSVCRACRLRSA